MKISTSLTGKLIDVRDLVPDSAPIVFVIGAMSHGSVRLYILLVFIFIITRQLWLERVKSCSLTGKRELLFKENEYYS
jgi:hypothetical protein